MLLFELELQQDIFGEHQKLTRAWFSTPKSKLVSPFQ
jgi:hypothetical protein